MKENLYNYINKANWTNKIFDENKAYVCSKFSQLVYGYKPKDVVNRTEFYEISENVLAENINIRQFRDQLFNNDFILLFILETPSSVTIGISIYKAIIVASRGTSYWKDWGINVNFLKNDICKFNNLKFHRGFNKIALIKIDEVYKCLKKQKAPIYFTGHSLGGALSGIFYYNFTNSCLSNNSLLIQNIKSAYTFGMPRFCNKDIFTGLYHIYNPIDIIPRIPPKIFGYCNLKNEYELTQISLKPRVNRSCTSLIQLFRIIIRGGREHKLYRYISKLYLIVK